MMDTRKIIDLVFKLKTRGNEAYLFFENVLVDLNDPEKRNDTIERLTSCYSITQYADLSVEEEEILEQIIDSI